MKLRQAALIVVAVAAAAMAGGPGAGAQDFEYPVSGTITGKYYYCGSGGLHQALDIAGSCGSCVYASRGGTSYFYGGCGTSCGNNLGSTCNGGAGNYIRINHASGYSTRYLHGLAGTGVAGSVADSRKVLKRGSTGNSSGPHVHFDIWRYGTRQTAWLSYAAACYSWVNAGSNIPYNFAGIAAPSPDYGPHGCN